MDSDDPGDSKKVGDSGDSENSRGSGDPGHAGGSRDSGDLGDSKKRNLDALRSTVTCPNLPISVSVSFYRSSLSIPKTFF